MAHDYSRGREAPQQAKTCYLGSSLDRGRISGKETLQLVAENPNSIGDSMWCSADVQTYTAVFGPSDLLDARLGLMFPEGRRYVNHNILIWINEAQMSSNQVVSTVASLQSEAELQGLSPLEYSRQLGSRRDGRSTFESCIKHGKS